MNFLLHRHLAEDALDSAAAGVGAMLPDLWRIADRRVRARRAVDLDVVDARDGALASVLAGVGHHLDADAAFHASGAFVEGERAVGDAIAALDVAEARLRLFAHVTWELCLDGALVRRLGVRSIQERVAAGLGDDDDAAIARAASLHHFARAADADGARRAAFDARMHRILHGLATEPWIEGYATGPGVAARVSQIRGRVGLPALEIDAATRFGRALDGLAARADAALDAILVDPAYSQPTRRAPNGSTSAS
ncbi:MAG TPA: hypothetical protein VGM56_04660 [Byssovorax sp.]|jgi:hypothetical protein